MTNKAHTDGYCAPLAPTQKITIHSRFTFHTQPNKKQYALLEAAYRRQYGDVEPWQVDLIKLKMRTRNGVQPMLETITASPAEIDEHLPTYVKTPEGRSSLLKELSSNRESVKVFLKVTDKLIVYETTFMQSPFLFASVDGELAYLCTLDEVELTPVGNNLPTSLPRGTAAQTSVWQDPAVASAKALGTSKSVAQLAFEKLLDLNNCILSDQTQSKLGRKFWERMVTTCLAEGYKVYAFEVEDADTLEVLASTRIHSSAEMAKYYAHSSSPDGYRYRFLIKK
jgi:hypothetical protein